jgi:hypothetical protein
MTVARSAAAVARWEREKAERRQLVQEAVEMRKNAYSFRAIAEHQGCTIQTATQRFRRGSKQYLPPELVESSRATELDRFDALTHINLTLLAEAVKDRDIDSVCKLQDKILAIHDRRAKLIPMQVPVKMVIDGLIDGATDQDRELTALLSAAAQDVEEKIQWLVENTAE